MTRWLRNRYPSWFRYVVHDDGNDTPVLDLTKRVHPSSDGTADAPMDDRSNLLFIRIAIGVAVVGAVLVVVALLGR